MCVHFSTVFLATDIYTHFLLLVLTHTSLRDCLWSLRAGRVAKTWTNNNNSCCILYIPSVGSVCKGRTEGPRWRPLCPRRRGTLPEPDLHPPQAPNTKTRPTHHAKTNAEGDECATTYDSRILRKGKTQMVSRRKTRAYRGLEKASWQHTRRPCSCKHRKKKARKEE